MDTSSGNDFLHREILQLLLEKNISGATLIMPEAGFGSHHRLHEQHASGAAGSHLPARIEFLESAEKFEEIAAELCALVSDGVIEIQDTTILKVKAG
jgi:PII-like signaling protein